MLAVAIGLAGFTGAAAVAGPAGADPVGTGQLTGNVVVHNAPAGFSGEVGIVACPSGTPVHELCADPQYAFSGSGGSYTLGLTAGSWQVNTWYNVGYTGGAFIGRARTVVIPAGATVRLNIGVRYQVPSSVAGTVSVTGVPAGVTIQQVQVTACPTSSPMVGGFPSPLCATDYLEPGAGQYSLPTLYKGTWLLYVGYYDIFGFTTATTPSAVTLKKGASLTDNLSLAYQTPTSALVEGKVTITGAPTGFSPTSGVGGCPAVAGPVAACPDPQYTLGAPDGTYQVVLPDGSWNLAGFYELAFYGGQFLSTVQNVNLVGGEIDHLDFTVPYVKPAKVTSLVTVTGVPAGQVLQGTILLACPSEFPYEGTIQPIECVTDFTPGGAPNVIDTLPAGTWLLYPGYVASSGDEVIGTTATPVTLKAGHSKVRNLTIPFTAG